VSTQTSRDEPPRAGNPQQILEELLSLEREITELDYVQRSDALERVRDALRRLEGVGSPEGILSRAAEELGESSQFERVLISELVDTTIKPRAIWAREGPAADIALAELQRTPIRLEYPLIEEEVARHQRVELVEVEGARSRAASRLSQVLGWRAYVVAPLSIQGKTIGLLHAETATGGRALGPLDAEVAEQYAEGLAGVFERAALRETLRQHREELQSAARWMSARLGQLAAEGTEWSRTATGASDAGLVEALTPRELDVLRLLARGHTNGAIADALLVREGTVKYHVKNILRKLGATSRADAVSRYVRATGSDGSR
jgi:DNA-binding CsgD family transcriptional regulator